MKIILAKASAGTVYSGTKELSWEKKKSPLCCCNCFCSGMFCGLGRFKSPLFWMEKAPGLLKTAEQQHSDEKRSAGG